MLLWRISNHLDLTGLGGERLSGRWHTAAHGKRIVYFSEHPAVALVETLVNLSSDPAHLPAHFQLLKIASEDASAIAELSPRQLDDVDHQDLASTRTIGDLWLAGRRSALLRVPSIPSPESWNFLLNPLHPAASRLKLEWAKQIAYDERLFKLKKN